MGKGEAMRKDFHIDTNSIDTLLNFIEEGIENPEKEGIVGDLLDAHSFFTRLKVKNIESSRKEVDDEYLFTYAYIITSSLQAVFGNWEANTNVFDRRIVLNNDLVYIDLTTENGLLECSVAFGKTTSPALAAELINTIRGFLDNVKISDEVFITDVNNNYVWGEESIAEYYKKINGIHVKPIIYFGNEDGEGGHC